MDFQKNSTDHELNNYSNRIHTNSKRDKQLKLNKRLKLGELVDKSSVTLAQIGAIIYNAFDPEFNLPQYLSIFELMRAGGHIAFEHVKNKTLNQLKQHYGY